MAAKGREAAHVHQLGQTLRAILLRDRVGRWHNMLPAAATVAILAHGTCKDCVDCRKALGGGVLRVLVVGVPAASIRSSWAWMRGHAPLIRVAINRCSTAVKPSQMHRAPSRRTSSKRFPLHQEQQ